MLVSLGPAYTATAARIEGVRQGPPIYASSTASTILAFIRAINASITIVLDDVFFFFFFLDHTVFKLLSL